MKSQQFLSYCSNFVGLSQRENKSWTLLNANGGAYLRLMKTLEFGPILEKPVPVEHTNLEDLNIGLDPSSANEYVNKLCSIEFHVVFNESYEVPVLLFNIYKEHGGKMNMEEAWHVLQLCREVDSSKQYETLTMVEHPLLFRPFLCLHPCKTMDILSGLESENPIITFLTTYGRFVNLVAEDLPSFELS